MNATPAPGRHPHPRFQLLRTPTPLAEHPSLGARLGDVRFFIKRDDFGEIGGGGNKLRKLEFAVGAARRDGADTLVTFGALQSNHARLTAAVAARAGMRCELILSKRVPRSDPAYETSGNMLLMKLFGANVNLLETAEDPLERAERLVAQLRARHRRPYVIPFGGSDVLGALGYAACAQEIVGQLHAQGLGADHVVVASGSGGTQAGLVAGFHAAGSTARVHGVSVLHPSAKLKDVVSPLVEGTCEALEVSARGARVETDDRFVGEGYGIPNAGTMLAIRELASSEGLILDPVYTGKAFAGLLAAAREGRFRPGECVVFVHTGGLPGLFAYASEFEPQTAQA